MVLLQKTTLYKKTAYILALIVFLCSTLQFRSVKTNTEMVSINLRWYKGYEAESWQDVRTGMLWSFSYMGAMLPKDSFDGAITFKDSTAFSINLSVLGFNKQALEALSVICDSIKKTEDYQRNQYIDVSRFFALSLYSPYNYYKITGAEYGYGSFLKRHKLHDPFVFGVTKSGISKGHRLIKFSKDTSLFKLGFIAEEGYGHLTDGSFKSEVFEVFDVMPNGQLRYAIYNKNGELTDAPPSDLSAAGKPAKCMWCHEIVIQPLFTENIPVEKMLDNKEFLNKVKKFQQQINAYRKTLNSDIDFDQTQAHTKSELLYIGFMEPSIYRLKQEFANDSTILEKILQEETHLYQEFPFLGNLYHRNKIDTYFDYSKIRVPEFVRDKSTFEPNYFH